MLLRSRISWKLGEFGANFLESKSEWCCATFCAFCTSASAGESQGNWSCCVNILGALSCSRANRGRQTIAKSIKTQNICSINNLWSTFWIMENLKSFASRNTKRLGTAGIKIKNIKSWMCDGIHGSESCPCAKRPTDLAQRPKYARHYKVASPQNFCQKNEHQTRNKWWRAKSISIR